MASLVNSVRSIMGDSWWLIKLSVFASLLFFVMDNDLNYQNGNPALTPVYISIFALMLGFVCIAMNRNIHNKSPLFPGLFNILEIIIKTIGSSICVLPGLIVYFFIIDFLHSRFVFETNIMIIIHSCIIAVLAPFILIPMVLYSVNGKLTDAFNMKTIVDASGNFIVQILSYAIQYIFIVGAVTYLLYFSILNMLGDHVGLLILKTIIIVISFVSLFIFCSDLYGDVIPEMQVKQKVKKLKSKR